MKYSKEVRKRFYKYVDKFKECWIWRAGITASGYGVFSLKRKQIRAHRMSYMLSKGKIPKGKLIIHNCHNRRCVRPSHLKASTQSVNIKQAWAIGNIDQRGSKHPAAKLDEESVLEIRRIKKSVGWTNKKLSIVFGVSSSVISEVINRKLWTHI